jgi:hypothetical protein
MVIKAPVVPLRMFNPEIVATPPLIVSEASPAANLSCCPHSYPDNKENAYVLWDEKICFQSTAGTPPV